MEAPPPPQPPVPEGTRRMTIDKRKWSLAVLWSIHLVLATAVLVTVAIQIETQGEICVRKTRVKINDPTLLCLKPDDRTALLHLLLALSLLTLSCSVWSLCHLLIVPSSSSSCPPCFKWALATFQVSWLFLASFAFGSWCVFGSHLLDKMPFALGTTALLFYLAFSLSSVLLNVFLK